MKKLVPILLFLMALIASPAPLQANEQVDMETRNKGNDNQSGRKRAPLHLPITVWHYDEESLIVVDAPADMEGSVALYNEAGNIVFSSVALANEISTQALPSGMYTLVIDGSTWISTGAVYLLQ